jgi:hypothetical protein
MKNNRRDFLNKFLVGQRVMFHYKLIELQLRE